MRNPDDIPFPSPPPPPGPWPKGGLTILGRSHNGDTIWFDVGHGEQDATEVEIDQALRIAEILGSSAVWSPRPPGYVCLDEQSLITLLAAFNAPHPLYPLVACFCGDADAVQFVDGRPYCHGHAQGFTAREEGQ